MRIQCPGCGAKLNVPDDRAGRTGRCPRCRQAIPIVAEGASADVFAESQRAAAPVESSETPLPRLAKTRVVEAAGTANSAAPADARTENAESKPKTKKKKKKKGASGDLLQRLESLKGWQMAGLALGAIGAVLLGVVLVVTVLTPVVDAALDAAYSAPPAPRIPDEHWKPANFGPHGKVLLPGGTRPGRVLASAVVLTVHEYKPNDDSVFAVAHNAQGLSPDRMAMKPYDLLNDFCDGFRNNVHAQGGVELTRRSFRVGELPAVEMVSRVPVARGKLVHRAIFADNDLYVLVAGGKGYTPEHPDVRRFLESFEFNPKPVTSSGTPAVTVDPALHRDALAKLKEIGAAIKGYEEANKTFPPNTFTDDTGAPTLSWRVGILPYLGYSELYDEFHLSEPWDSPHNKTLIAKMPPVFAPRALQDLPPGETPFQALIAPSAVFDPAAQHTSADVTDGVSRTLIVAEAATTVPWTKPADLDVSQSIPTLGRHFSAGFLALAADGEAYAFPAQFNGAKLRNAITRAGGEPGEIADIKD